MKKNIKDARITAQLFSKEHLHVDVRVMTKPGRPAVVCASSFVYRERILDGWTVAATYRNGIEV